MIKDFDEDKCNKMLEELLEVFQHHKPAIREILLVYGNLGYSIGASIAGYNGKGPSLDELRTLYLKHPNRVDIALMLEGLTITSWFESYVDELVKEHKKDNGS